MAINDVFITKNIVQDCFVFPSYPIDSKNFWTMKTSTDQHQIRCLPYLPILNLKLYLNDKILDSSTLKCFCSWQISG